MKLRIGVGGARRGAGPAKVFGRHPDCELVALADRNPDVLKALGDDLEIDPARRFDDLADLCRSDVDAIFVSTPAPLHAEHSIAALRAGKHVLCEVPAVYSEDEGRRLLRTVRETGLKYGLAENMCYIPYVQEYKRLIAQGELGEVIYAEGEYIHNCERLCTDRPDGMGGGAEGRLTWRARLAPIQYCTHDLGPLLQALGGRCVTAVGMHTGNRRRKDLGVIDIEIGLFRTSRNVVIKLLMGFSVAKDPSHHWYCIYGTAGQLEQERQTEFSGHTAHRIHRAKDGAGRSAGLFSVPNTHPSAPAHACAGGHGTSEFYMVDEFVQSILRNTKPPIDVYDALDWTLPGICAHVSAESGGRPVAVPDPREW